MTVDEQKEIARRALEAFSGGDVDRLRSFLTPNAVFHQCGFLQPISGEALLRGGFLAGGRIHDREIRLEHMVGEGDIVALQWRTSGHYSDPESPARDGAAVDVPSMTFVRFEGDKIAEVWNIRDGWTLQSQLSEAAAPGGTGAGST